MLRSITVKLAMLLSLGEPTSAGVSELRQQLLEFAGENVNLDQRLRVPDCGGDYALRWSGPDRAAIAASCDAAGWRVVLPYRSGTVRIRRGQLVRVEATGQGFRLSADAVAEDQAGPGAALTVRNSASGRRFGAVAAADGRVVLPGQSGAD